MIECSLSQVLRREVCEETRLCKCIGGQCSSIDLQVVGSRMTQITPAPAPPCSWDTKSTKSHRTRDVKKPQAGQSRDLGLPKPRCRVSPYSSRREMAEMGGTANDLLAWQVKSGEMLRL